MVKVSIVGGSGYAGGELLRILINHPYVEIHQITSQNYKGQPVSLLHPNLRGKINKNFCDLNELQKVDLLFLALPNLTSMLYIDKLASLADYIIDLGADFRIKNLDLFKEYYHQQHTAQEWLNKFIYALPEINREEIKKYHYISCPGCEATAIILALYPLLKEGFIDHQTRIIADVKIGSSASGSKPSLATHHPERNNVIRTYQAFGHRHEAEIKDFLGLNVEITATAVEIVRGILATLYIFLDKQQLTEKDLWKVYFHHYQKEPFIRIINQKEGLYRLPEPKILWGTNYCDLGFKLDNKKNKLIVLSAIDNLVKGTAGQAVQIMNILLGFDERLGLEFTGLHPI
jgi:N-acetyl-gamma-glutamyl-phosphate/LysW-gamma-L-alpha-aminoadipyl-6-phosphate reductase